MCEIEFFFIFEWNESTYAMIRLRKIQKIRKSWFWHHFETPYWYQNVWNWILFHFRMKWVNLRNDPPTQNSKNPKIMVLAPFWNPILVPNCAELNSFSFPNEMSQPTQWSAHAKFKTSENQGFGTILKPHIGIKLCRIEFSFTSKRNESAHAMTHPRKIKKKMKIQVLAPFWDSIAAKMKNSDKMTSIDKVPSVFDNQKLSFAHAKKLFVLKFISVVCI